MFDDVGNRPKPHANQPVKFGKGGGYGYEFNVETTCNPDGQCWAIDSKDPRDIANQAAFLVEAKKRQFDPFEAAAGAVKNIAAGLINSVVPGGNLGDSNSDFRAIGEVAGALIGPGKIVQGVTKIAGNVSFLSNLISSANKAVTSVNQLVSSPIGQIVAPVIGSAVASMTNQIPVSSPYPVKNIQNQSGQTAATKVIQNQIADDPGSLTKKAKEILGLDDGKNNILYLALAAFGFYLLTKKGR